MGRKKSLKSRTYNVIRMQIIHVTNGFPARWNDKTIVKFEKLVNDVKSGNSCKNKSFKLLEYDEDVSVVEVLHKGTWILCDNGCIKWPILTCPFKLSTNRKEIRVSEWLEIM